MSEFKSNSSILAPSNSNWDTVLSIPWLRNPGFSSKQMPWRSSRPWIPAYQRYSFALFLRLYRALHIASLDVHIARSHIHTFISTCLHSYIRPCTFARSYRLAFRGCVLSHLVLALSPRSSSALPLRSQPPQHFRELPQCAFCSVSVDTARAQVTPPQLLTSASGLRNVLASPPQHSSKATRSALSISAAVPKA
ncbi:hypothetical protein BGX38DRAFT_702400 [Terfezia claveryi]|nr:hypothetical protein BGX38DRAFT_702400 [Terfezia claveryi]